MPPGKKVLIIDDETDLCLLLKDYFIRKSYDVTLAHTLTEGRQALESINPDILVLDNNLPDGIGWTSAPGIATAFPHMVIVLISAFHPQVPQMPAGSHFRAIEKPISLADLNKQFADL